MSWYLRSAESIWQKGRLGLIQEYPKAIQNRCRELGLIEESSGKLMKKATIGKIGFFIGYIVLQTVLAYYIGGARTFFTGWLHGYLMWVAEMWFDALVVDCLWFAIARNGNSGNRGYGRCLSRLLASHQICGDRNVYAGGDRPAGRTFRDAAGKVIIYG